DLSDAFKDGLKECRVVFRPRFESRRKLGVVDREAFAWLRKRIIVQASGSLRIQARGQPREAVARKELFDDLAARVRGAAGKPRRANPMAIDSKLRSEDRVVAQKL